MNGPPVVGVSMHLPIRPGWVCAGCGLTWPCSTRRQQLVAEYEGARVSLALLMAAYFADAANDLPYAQAGDLYARFLGWVRSAMCDRVQPP